MTTHLRAKSANLSLAAPSLKATREATKRERGFTILELMVVVTVIMVISAVALPSFMQAYRTYQLDDAATQVASVLKFTRYEAIRLNVTAAAPLAARTLQTAAGTNVYTDNNNSATLQVTEKQVLFSRNVNLVAAGVPPNTAGLAGAVGVAALTNVALNAGSIAFDQRGAVVPAAVNVLYIGNTSLPNLGNRAVIVLPSGSVQIWSTNAAGIWRQLS
jgi:prepilin-type N-terminal cleavage/methylation domain-containing protein